ncbi:MAG: alkaline phosphatase [Bacteroidales bacterium]|jgi:alkaline phosphatase|nr:alkaline phosphatase [Bacteroidales bacterium]MDI9592237.1 alkaline phosphatase [Bacteroidota bacterium]OQC38517.1 MAG: Alkaline phosphatase 4 precursor [Bacteroidetes bacterium ADurb.Bin041]HNV49584.1 alkaline phosphatase [Bacteroidales bacterium]HOR76557.1 alkaline phosphatase [Bacteroidales bacterium]
MITSNRILKIVIFPVIFFFFYSGFLHAQQAKYIFYFISDGMGMTHVAVTEAFLASQKNEIGFERLSFTKFPTTGFANNNALNRLITCSAAAGTALSTGQKTTINTIGMNGTRDQNLYSIASIVKREGYKVGIISNVSINHATPSVFYAHQPSRNNYYEIGLDLISSNYDFFGGGGFYQATGKDKDKPDLYQLAKQAGYHIVQGVDQLNNLKRNDNRVIAISNFLTKAASQDFVIDQNRNDIPLSLLIDKAIELLDNDKGFFIMAEEGNHDWAAHANDGATAIWNIIGLSDAVERALEFYKEHPNETLIIVTADHETGGITLGWSGKNYETDLSLLVHQKVSFSKFAHLLDSTLKIPENQNYELILKLINEYFGLGGEGELALSDYENKLLSDAWKCWKGELQISDMEKQLNYGNENPIAVTATRILNHKAGLGWTTWAHTGTPVPVFAIGQGHEMFNGYYHITDIPKKIKMAMGLDK